VVQYAYASDLGIYLTKSGDISERRPLIVDNNGGGMSVVLRRGSIIRYRGQWMAASRRVSISSCQSAATCKIVKRCCSGVFSCKQRYIKYPEKFQTFAFTFNTDSHAWRKDQ